VIRILLLLIIICLILLRRAGRLAADKIDLVTRLDFPDPAKPIRCHRNYEARVVIHKQPIATPAPYSPANYETLILLGI
jgi:hypothetical protein